jgi:hypothetical protein
MISEIKTALVLAPGTRAVLLEENAIFIIGRDLRIA